MNIKHLSRRIIKRTAAAFVAAALLIGTALALFPVAAASQITTATYSSPALGTDTGLKLDLTACSVQFEKGRTPISGKDIVWTVDGKTVTEFLPSEVGVTAATAVSGSQKRTVYLVAKAPADADYVIYSNDFSVDPTSELRVVQKTAGTKIEHDAAKGTLKLNASNDGSAYIRVLLPSWLDCFGDAIIDTSMYLSNPNGPSSRWGAVMFRVQKNDYPYMLNTFRFDSTLSNGVELGQRTESDAWNIMKTASTTLSNTKFNDVRISVAGASAVSSVGGRQVLDIDSAEYSNGSFGLQVRGVSMIVDSIKICLNPNSTVDIPTIPGNYADLVLPESNIALSPTVIARAVSLADVERALSCGASSVLFNLAYNDGSLSVSLKKDGGELAVLDIPAVYELLGNRAIPAFATDDISTVKELAQLLRKNNLRDSFLISSELITLDTAKSQWNYVNTVYRAAEDPIDLIKDKAVANGARIVILPESMMTRNNIDFLQDRYLTVWADGIDSEVSAVTAVNKGVCGLITTVPETSVECLTKYYAPNTLTRYSNITGHRGIPSKAQENSLEGSVLAAEYGATCVENDIYLVKDGVLMVMHDSTIDRTTTGTGKITSMTSAELAKYKINTYAASAPVPIPSLEDYLKEFKDSGVTLVIEIKENNTGMASPLAKLLREYDMTNQAVIISFHETPLKAIRQVLPGISEAYLNSSIAPSEENALKVMAEVMTQIQPLRTVYSPSYASGALGNKLTGALFARGVTTWIWTVNNLADFNTYFLAGTRGITTNYVDWASKYIKELNAEFDSDTGEVRVFATDYKGNVTDVTKDAELVCLDSNDTVLSFADGKVTGTGDNSNFFFRLDCRTSNGKHYSKVTELISLVTEKPATTEAETTTAPSASETVPSPEKKGCGSVSCAFAVAAAVSFALILVKKKEF